MSFSFLFNENFVPPINSNADQRDEPPKWLYFFRLVLFSNQEYSHAFWRCFDQVYKKELIISLSNPVQSECPAKMPYCEKKLQCQVHLHQIVLQSGHDSLSFYFFWLCQKSYRCPNKGKKHTQFGKIWIKINTLVGVVDTSAERRKEKN